jgi:hypothetical protein
VISPSLPPALRSGDEHLLFGIDKESITPESQHALATMFARLKITIQYNSLYDETFAETMTCIPLP